MKKNVTWAKNEIENLKNKNLLISFKSIQSPIGSQIKINEQWYLNFSSNNYLGLANNTRIKNASIKAIKKFGIGPAAVRTIAGTSTLHMELEKKLSTFKKTQDTITFQSGFVTNCAVIPSLTTEGDLIFSDELNHASIIDACKLSKATVIRYDHSNIKDLDAKLKKYVSNKDIKAAIVTDGVFSMDGDIANLPEIVRLAKKYKAITIVDDAHGEGVLGENGRGIVDYFNLHGKVDIEVGTLSKAFGVVGGFASGRKDYIDLLRQKARPFLFSSAMTFPDVGASIEAVNILQKSDKLVKKLWENTSYFQTKLKRFGFNTGTSQTPITPLIVGDERLAKDFANKLFTKKLFAKSITYPTVALSKARIRLMISAAHSKMELDKAVEIISEVGHKLRIIK